MTGIRYVVDDAGNRTAVVIELHKYGEFWEDIYDALTAAKRRNEPRESLSKVRARLQRSVPQGRCQVPSIVHRPRRGRGS